jgi:hypothetical protein
MSQNLSELWRVRNAAAVTLGLTEDQMRHAIRDATVDELVTLLEGFSPARSPGTDWTRTFEPLIERLWLWRDDATMAALADVFRARGMPWMAVTNALSPDNGAMLRGTMRHPAPARLPAFTVV